VDPRSRSLVVLGGSGFLGAQVLRRAAAAGWKRAVSLSRATGLDLAAADARAIEGALRSHGASAVLVCAALAKIDECEREPERAAATNERAPREVARACAALGLRLVHVSAVSETLTTTAALQRLLAHRTPRPPSTHRRPTRTHPAHKKSA